MDLAGLFLDQVPIPIHLDQQHRPPFFRYAQIETPLHALQGGVIHEFQGSGDYFGADDG